jgi:hypothetical protein
VQRHLEDAVAPLHFDEFVFLGVFFELAHAVDVPVFVIPSRIGDRSATLARR